MAIDFQGQDKARLFHELAKATFTTVIDESNSLGAAYGFRAIPNGLLIGADGTLRFYRFGSFDIRKPDINRLVKQFVVKGNVQQSTRATVHKSMPLSSHDHFTRGLTKYQSGDLEAARSIWREGVALEPDNWVLRKQLWAMENPERFYKGEVDYEWQRSQIERGR